MFKRPIVCNYFLTLRCNDTCEFCEVWQKEEYKDLEESSFDTINNNLKDLKKMGVLAVDFTGGEPLLRPDLPKILKASKDLGLYNILTTNGILFKDRVFEISRSVDKILFSLDSPLADEHDRIRGTACYEEVIDGIKTAKKNMKDVAINFTATRDSILFLPEMVDLAEKLGVLLWVNPVYRYGGAEGLQSESIGYITRYKGRKNVAFNYAGLDLMQKGGNNINRPLCRAVDSVVTILPDDRLVSPCFYKQEFSAKIKGKLREMYGSNDLEACRIKQGKFEECKGCFAWPYLNPSFLYGYDKRLLMALFSIGLLFYKEKSLRREKSK